MRKKPLIIVLTKRDSYHSAILQGFCAEQIALGHADRVEISVVVVEQGSFANIGKQVQAALDLKPAIIVSIGIICTQAVMYIMHEQNNKTPFIFCGVTSLQDESLERMLESESSMITGVSLGYPSYRTMARTLMWVKPDIKSVLIPYSPTREGGVLTSAALLIKEFLSAHKVAVHLQPLLHDIDPLGVIREKILGVDAILGLEGCVVDDYYQDIIPLCNTYSVAYFTSSLSAVRAGAAVGLINDPSLVGSYALRKCLGVINNNFMPDKGAILLLKNEGRRMAFNAEACAQQNVIFSPEKWYLLKHLDVLGSFYHLIDNEGL